MTKVEGVGVRRDALRRQILPSEHQLLVVDLPFPSSVRWSRRG